MSLAPAEPLRTVGPWIDLSYPLSRSMPRQPLFPEPRFDRFMSVPEAPLNVTLIEMVAHIGTHVDSPRHCFDDAPSFEDLPLERLCGLGVVHPVIDPPNGEIGPDQLEPVAPVLPPGSILLLNTGTYHAVGTDAFQDHPFITPAGAAWLVEHRVKLVGFDTPTPEAPYARRSPDFDFPIHRALLGHGVLVAEHLTALDQLNGQQVEVACHALNIAGADGSPTRIVARRLADVAD